MLWALALVQAEFCFQDEFNGPKWPLYIHQSVLKGILVYCFNLAIRRGGVFLSIE